MTGCGSWPCQAPTPYYFRGRIGRRRAASRALERRAPISMGDLYQRIKRILMGAGRGAVLSQFFRRQVFILRTLDPYISAVFAASSAGCAEKHDYAPLVFDFDKPDERNHRERALPRRCRASSSPTSARRAAAFHTSLHRSFLITLRSDRADHQEIEGGRTPCTAPACVSMGTGANRLSRRGRFGGQARYANRAAGGSANSQRALPTQAGTSTLSACCSASTKRLRIYRTVDHRNDSRVSTA